MANLRDLKKDINFVLGDIIEAVQIWQMANDDKDHAQSEKIIDDAISLFDDLMGKVNDRKVENRKAHLKTVRTQLETDGRKLIDRFNKL